MNKYIKLRLTKPKTNRDSKIKVVNREKFKDIKPTVLISKSSFVITISQDNIFKTSLYHITKETNDSSTTIKSKVNNHSGMNSSLSNILSHKFMNIKGKNVLPKIYQSNSSICSQRRNCSDFIPIQLYKY